MADMLDKMNKPVPDKRTYAVCCYMVLYDADGQAYIRRMLLYGVVRRRRTSVHTPYAAIWCCMTQTDKRTYAVCCYMMLCDADGQAYIRRMLLYGVVRRRFLLTRTNDE
ncbi:hypothetical protein DPMN_169159 [Dreissena polymorpha]|uniref:Uncharacterized protein n=1 Tax=Dreissena polymorpha TaxID=45954 RepID=A0A9D4F419_DREPO|nr:hypothetical protein DPMN_169159 [Dreissena polymorpha]